MPLNKKGFSAPPRVPESQLITSVRLQPATLAKLRAYAAAERRSVSQVVNLAIESFIAQNT